MTSRKFERLGRWSKKARTERPKIHKWFVRVRNVGMDQCLAAECFVCGKWHTIPKDLFRGISTGDTGKDIAAARVLAESWARTEDSSHCPEFRLY